MADNQWISWICGWFAVSGWIALVATAGSLAGSLITGAISLTHENYEVERWHIFLIYLAYMLGACFINIFGLRLLPTIDRAAIFWCASPKIQRWKVLIDQVNDWRCNHHYHLLVMC